MELKNNEDFADHRSDVNESARLQQIGVFFSIFAFVAPVLFIAILYIIMEYFLREQQHDDDDDNPTGRRQHHQQ